MNCANMDWTDGKAYFKELFRRAEAARVPLSGSLELTRRCNLRCIHCYLGPQECVRSDLRSEMTTAQVLAIIDQIVAAGCLNLLITGGEPLLRPDFDTIYRHAKLAGLHVTVFTNGTLLTDRIIDLFRDLPPWIVEVSVYGATAATYEQITGIPGSYNRCLAGIRRLSEAGIRLCLKTMLMTKNSHELGAIEDLAQTYGAKFRFDPVLNTCLDGGREPLRLRVDAAQVVRLEFANPERAQKWVDVHTRYPNLAPSDRLYPCGAAETGFHVDAFGNLQPCVMLPEVSRSLLSGAFAEAWASLAYLRQVKVDSASGCALCPRRLYCGYCPGLLALENGNAQIPSRYLCALGDERLQAIRHSLKGD
jgi:radical SAM protein with 4Fe4S-binding SPASM domain